VAIESQHNIVKLQITVDDAVLVEILQGQTDFCGIKSAMQSAICTESQMLVDLLCPLSAELSSLNVQHQISTTDILHDEVDSCFRLEASMKAE